MVPVSAIGSGAPPESGLRLRGVADCAGVQVLLPYSTRIIRSVALRNL